MPEISLKCACGKVQGKTTNMTAQSGNRLICCCDDCQAFAAYLDNAEQILDEYGGTDIFQVPISSVSFSQGQAQFACMRLSEKGLYRWYTKCCNTPIGNTLGSRGPFIGLIHNILDNVQTRDTDIGKPRAYLQIKYAKKRIPKAILGSSTKTIGRFIVKITTWKIKGLNKPSVFFESNGNPLVNPYINKN